MNELEAALTETAAALANAEQRQQVLTDQIKSLRAEHHGLELALARRRSPSSDSRDETPAKLDDIVVSPVVGTRARPNQELWNHLHRHQAVERMMLQMETPVRPVQVAALLQAVGRTDCNAANVSMALGYLRDQGKAIHVEKGKWRLSNPSDGVRDTRVISEPIDWLDSSPQQD